MVGRNARPRRRDSESWHLVEKSNENVDHPRGEMGGDAMEQGTGMGPVMADFVHPVCSIIRLK